VGDLNVWFKDPPGMVLSQTQRIRQGNACFMGLSEASPLCATNKVNDEYSCQPVPVASAVLSL
jgi:hypothetical protein